MELGLSTSILGTHALPDRLDLLAEHGPVWVEIHGYVTEEFDFGDFDLVKRTAQALERLGLRLWSVHSPAGRPLDVSALDPEIQATSLDVMHQAMEAAADMGAGLFVCDAVGPKPGSREERQQRLPILAASLAELLEAADRLHLRLVIENHSFEIPLYGAPSEFRDIVQNYGLDGLGSCWDTGHGWMGGHPPQAACELGKDLLTLHIHDNDGVRDLHLVPGEGTITWDAFVGCLSLIGYAGPFMMELAAPNPQEPGAIRERLRRAAEFYRRLLGS